MTTNPLFDVSFFVGFGAAGGGSTASTCKGCNRGGGIFRPSDYVVLAMVP